MMNRFIYYLIGLGLIVPFITFIPSILYENREEGSITSLIISPIIGVILIYLIASFFNRFPGQGIPELLKKYTSRWVAFPLLISLFLFWYIIGLKILASYSFLLNRFLTPDMPLWGITISLLIFVTFGILMASQQVLYTVEIIFLFSIPFIIFIVTSLITNNGIEWGFIGKAMMYVNHSPSYVALTATLFMFYIGIFSLEIFNREFKKRKKVTILQLCILFIFGAGILFTLYFLPIGYNGFENIHEITYPWLITSDSLRISLPFLERVMYIFLLVYLAISFLGMIISWHIALEILKSVVWFKSFKWKKRNLTPFIFILMIWIISLMVQVYMTEVQINSFVTYFYKILPLFILLKMLVFWYIYRRARE